MQTLTDYDCLCITKDLTTMIGALGDTRKYVANLLEAHPFADVDTVTNALTSAQLAMAQVKEAATVYFGEVTPAEDGHAVDGDETPDEIAMTELMTQIAEVLETVGIAECIRVEIYREE